MPPVMAPLEGQDYGVMGYDDHDKFSADVMRLNETHRRFVINVTVRLADIDWLSQTLDEQVRQGVEPPVKEGLLWLQIYLLLTCADILGHGSVAGDGVGIRFKAFFQGLPHDAQQHLVEAYLVWTTDWGELVRLGLAEPRTGNATYPSRSRIQQSVQQLALDKRLSAVVEFLYNVGRNPYTHEAEYPQLGWHPTLSVLQMQRVQLRHVARLGEFDHIQAAVVKGVWYFVFYNTDDPIAVLRRVVLQGFGAIVRGAQS